MVPNPICPTCHGDFVEEIEADNDPRDFIASAEEEDEMENEFGGAGNYNQDLQSMLTDMLTNIMGGRQPTNAAAAAAAGGSAGESGSIDGYDFQMLGSQPGDNIFSAAVADDGQGERRIPGVRTWTSNMGNAQMSFSVANIGLDDANRRWPGASESGEQAQTQAAESHQQSQTQSAESHQQSQTQSAENQQQQRRRPMFIDPEENAPLTLGNLVSSLLGALGGAGRGDEAGGTGVNPLFGMPVGNLGDYAWGQNSLDDIITRIMEQNQGVNAPPPATEAQMAKLVCRVILEDEVARHVECGICMEEYKAEEQVMGLPCKHFYHKECIDHWLRMNGTCPICRKGIEEEGGAEVPLAVVPRPHSELPGSFPSSPSQPQQQQTAANAAAGSEPGEPESEPLD
ncbi:hypothetical protein LPJ66_001946 [Kickxella alabastrina]|uniref:Uncharacterized protein n=1 Tax=Kickxella alabastrina TaxID=61397 RepID=A0ACC1IS32_9FUNG|nr:hypothetical protein LPJ66_001946 [Kickxella alabastrina]